MNRSVRSSRHLLVLLGAFFFFSFLPFVAYAAPAPLTDATVNLYCQFKTGNKTLSSSGSGVFVSERGIILTNAHVAKHFLLQGTEGKTTGTCSVRTGSPAKAAYTAAVLYISPQWLASSATKTSGTGEHDFALLYITGATKGSIPSSFPKLPLKLFSDARENETVRIAGYPTEKLNFKQVQNKLHYTIATSSITSLRTFTTSPYVDVVNIAPSAAGSAGISGGPVINEASEVIGIATALSSSKKDRTLRAITIPYIDRVVQSETGLPLNLILWGNLPARASTTAASIPTDTIKTLRTSLFKKK